MKAEKIIEELEANYGYKFERDYPIKFKEYKQLIKDVVNIVSTTDNKPEKKDVIKKLTLIRDNINDLLLAVEKMENGIKNSLSGKNLKRCDCLREDCSYCGNNRLGNPFKFNI